MSSPLRLQAGGTLNPRRHIYISRPEDDGLLQLLLTGQYVNVLTSRQMGKSSLMIRTIGRLAEHGVRSIAIDLAGEIGTPDNVETFYVGLLSRVARDLGVVIDLASWWQGRAEETSNQRFLRFFREVVAKETPGPLVIFLDEIDSTLKLGFTDDLFTAIRSMYNDRPLVPAYERITFCLLGVASANELVKNRRSTPYNVGENVDVGDFDPAREDVRALATVLSDDPSTGAALLERVLHWTGGHPYLTARLCLDLRAAGASAPADVDGYVENAFIALDRVSGDAHFAQTLRFVETRLTSGRAALSLYRRILRGAREKDVPAVAHNELKLSGLVKRDAEGYLVIRNPIYRRLFDLRWVESLRGMRERGIQRFAAIGSLLVGTIAVMMSWAQTREVGTLEGVAFSPDGRHVAIASDKSATLWDTESGQLLRTLQVTYATAVAFSPDGRHVAIASSDDSVTLWDNESGQLRNTLKGHTSRVESVAFSRDGRRVATGSWDNTARIWDAESGQPLRTLKGDSWVRSVAFSPDGRLIATGSEDKRARIWDAETGQLLRTLEGHQYDVRSVAFSPDSRRVATAGSFDKVRLWEAESGQLVRTLEVFATTVAFSPDGRQVVADLTICDAETGQVVRTLLGDTSGASKFAVSPDGRRVATGSSDSTVRLWDAESGKVLRYYGGRLKYLLTRFARFSTDLGMPAALACLVLLLALDFVVIRELVGGPLSATPKAGWSMIVLCLPLLGILLWLLVRPGRAATAPVP